MDLRLLGYEQGRATEPTVWRCIENWADIAQETLNTLGALGGKWETWVETFGLHRIKDEVEVYRRWVEANDARGKGVVFARECL